MKTKNQKVRSALDKQMRKMVITSVGSVARSRCSSVISDSSISRVFNAPDSPVTMETLIRISVASGLRFRVKISGSSNTGPSLDGYILNEFFAVSRREMDDYIQVVRHRIAHDIRMIAKGRGVSLWQVEKENGLPKNSLTRRCPPMVDTLVSVLINMSVKRTMVFNQWRDEYPFGLK